MTEVLFYHLQGQPLETVLPTLIEKSLERGWKAVVQSGDPERLAALDDHLWTYDEQSFIPHGLADEPDSALHAVALAADDANPNGAAIRFLVAGAQTPPDAATYTRIVVIFDGEDDVALTGAREQWRAVKAAGHEATYWRQDERGRWNKMA
ncbi:MAG: DNA polymerase III subunit chi [Microvirga sp.]|nr:DNA polymerase III subunit chi [Microvirga sp.]